MGKSYPIQSRLDENNLALLKAKAEEKGLSLSMMIRLIIINYLSINKLEEKLWENN